ncbi:MAG: BMP family ABC transporter substrate-binding protein [Spirochaetales bacterium]|nr:MAG: BMP family ABC transporter substrate-binding protein [Spirochaetales bacterium]
MKYRTILIALLAVALVFSSCAKKEEAPEVMAPTFKVGLVTDLGGIDDKSFNQGTWEGIVRFAQEKGLVKGTDIKYLQSAAEADYVPNLSTFADEKLDLIVAPGFLFEKAMGEVADKYPNQKLLVIDTVVQKPNVVSAVFAEHEGSFLVGVVAGLKAKADGKSVLGFIGGMQFPLIEKFQAGFEQGVKAVFPTAKILVDYAGDFGAPDKGQAIAQKQFNAGAYIIFHAAGGTGNGMIKEAKERSEKGDVRWAIGVDKDQYTDGMYGDKSAVLTSMMKRVDVAAHDVAQMALDGQFPGGQVLVFSLKNNGVGVPDSNPNLSADIMTIVKEYATKIASGELVVSEIPAK